MLALLRLRDFRLLLAGGLVSNLGSWLIVVAVPYHVFQVTGSAAATGFTLAAESLPALLVGPIAGVFVDRWDHRTVMIATNLLRAIALADIPLADRPDRIWLLYAAVLAENLGSVFFRPAARAMWPAVVGTAPELAAANSMLATALGVVQLAGPPLGALLLTWLGLTAVVLLDLASYLIAAVAIAATRTRTPRPAGTSATASGRAGAGGRVVAELAAGARFTAAHPMLRGILVLTFGFFSANAVFTALLIPFMTTRFGGHPGLLGVQLSALGAGYLLGAPVAGRLVALGSPRFLLLIGLAGVGGCFTALATAPTAAVAVVATGLAGLPGAVVYVTVETTLQRVTPPGLLGRIGAVFYAADAAGGLVGALVAASAGDHAQLSSVLAGSACAILLFAAGTPILVPGATDGHPGYSIRVISRIQTSRFGTKFAGQRPSSGPGSKSPDRPSI